MLRPDYYKDPVTGAIAGIEPKELDGHISHCIDELRQSIICHSDIRFVSRVIPRRTIHRTLILCEAQLYGTASPPLRLLFPGQIQFTAVVDLIR